MLDQARELLRALQNEEQIVLNQRMRDQEWAAQSTQILDLLPKLERSVVEMEKEKRGYLLTGNNDFAEGISRATAAFANYQGYLVDSRREEPGASRAPERNPHGCRSLGQHVRHAREWKRSAPGRDYATVAAWR